MKKILLASLILASSGGVMIATVGQSFRADAPAKVQPNSPTDVKLSFGYEDGDPAIFISFKAPTTSYSWMGDGDPLTENIDKIELSRRESGSYGDWELVATFTDVAPGTPLSCVDKGITEGKTYQYLPQAFIGDESSSSWNYEDVYAGIKPAKPQITAESFQGSAPVTVTVVAPSTLDTGEPMEQDLTAILITRTIGYGDEVDVHTFAAPLKGETYSWTDEDYKNLTDGSSVTYYAYAKIGNFSSDGAYTSVRLQKDVPASPETVTAKEEEDGVMVTWTPVTKGAYGYWFDPATVRYTVYRVSSNGVSQELASDLNECEYFDDLSDVKTRNSFCWKVVATNEAGEGYGTDSNYLMEGPLPTLPLLETFNTPGTYYPTADNFWTSEALDGGYYKFEVENHVNYWDLDLKIYSYGNEDGSDSNAGLLQMEGSKYSKTEAIYTSGEISTKDDKEAKLTFMYYALPKSKSILYVELVNPEETDPDDAVTVLATLSMNGSEAGWQQYVVDNISVEDFNSIQLRFHGLTDPDDGRNGVITPICIDDIALESNKSISSGVNEINASVVGEEYYTLTGIRTTNPAKGQILIRVRKMSNGQTETSKVVY